MNFGEYIEKALDDKKIKKAKFAEKVGVSRQSLATNIDKWKSGREPNIKTMKKYISALGLDLSDFFKQNVS